MSSDLERRPAGGGLNAAVSNAVVRIHSRYVGRGATRAHSFHRGAVIVTVLEDVMTTAERSLVADGRSDVVRRMRDELHATLRPDLVAEVEQLSGRRVLACLSDHEADADVAAAVFVLESPPAGEDEAQAIG
jgi:uncharacterized protein YbcI